MFQRRFNIGVWIEVSGIDRKEIGKDHSLGLPLPLHHYRKLWSNLHSVWESCPQNTSIRSLTRPGRIVRAHIDIPDASVASSRLQ